MSAQDQSHDSLIDRLAAICHERGVDYTSRPVIGKTPFGKPFRADLVVTLPSGDLAVCARHQESSGTAEEKLCHLALSINRSRRPCLVVLSGPGWSQGAIDWMGYHKGDRVLDIVDLEGFDAFLVAALRS
jgi:hypothetical protein